MLSIENVRERLAALADPKYRDFSQALVPGCDIMLGVRLPDLRKLAGELAQVQDAHDFVAYYLYANPHEYFEEVMLQGMLIGSAKLSDAEFFEYIRLFVPRINNWSICDSFCAGLRRALKNKSKREQSGNNSSSSREYQCWQFIQPYFEEQEAFKVRFAVVMSLDYFIAREYLEKLFMIYTRISCKDRNVFMAVGWALSVCCVRFPEETMAFLAEHKVAPEAQNWAVRKIRESLRISAEIKEQALGLRHN